MFKKIASLLILLGASLTASANYVYEANQSLFDLTNQTGTTNMAVGDDSVSAAFNLDFTFTFYGEDFTSARMATNGCLHFKSTGSYCNDYTPDPLPEITYTLYPFWTDLISDNGSKVLAKNFTDKTVFGWYNLREYNRSNTDNSFEVILWNSNDTFEFRYGGLNIINHDVLIGEQGTSSELYTYYYHDQCGKGTTNSSSCVSQTWNASTMNTTLENGGSLYGLGSGNALDCSNPLNNNACVGYDAAYLTQQCGLDSLHSTSCPLYWEAYDDLQCDLDPQYAPFCAGYTQEASVAYYVEDEFDYGYEEEYDYGYEEEYDYSYEEEFYYEDNTYYQEEEIYFSEQIDQEVYEEYITFFEEEYAELPPIIESIEEFEIFEDEYYFEDDEVFMATEEEYYEPIDIMEQEEIFIIQEEYVEFVADIFEQEQVDPIFLEEVLFEEFERREIILEEEYTEEEPVEYLEFETIEELEEWFEEEEEIAEELEEEVEEIEEEVEETRVAEEEKGGITSQMLNVVANTIQTATNSVSGTASGTSIHATGNTKASGGSVAGNTTATAVTSSVTGGQSMSNSPSISAQVVSSVVQTQQVLNSFSTDSSVTSSTVVTQNTAVGETTSTQNVAVGNTTGNENTAVGNTDSGSNVAVGSTATTTTETTTNTSVASNTSGNNNTAVGNTGGDENAAVGETTGPQNTAVVFENNIQDQQEQLEQQQEETGEYADSTQLVAYMGTVPGFDSYRQVALPQASAWYEPKDIYMSALMPDNNQAFFGMYSDSLNGLKALQDLQPNL